jgi:hypothetical protein
MAALLPNGNAYWPIVLQVSKETPDFEHVRGPFNVDDGRVMLGTNQSSVDTVVSYAFSLLEFLSFKAETLQVIQAYLQIYPADIHAFEYGKTGDVEFNGDIVRKFSLTYNYSEEGSFLDPNNYRFVAAKLDFPIPMYGYYSNQSIFIPIPSRLLDSQMNVTLRIDPKVLWEIFIISVIVHIIPEDITPWWSHNLPLIFALVSIELAVLVISTTVFFKTAIRKKAKV